MSRYKKNSADLKTSLTQKPLKLRQSNVAEDEKPEVRPCVSKYRLFRTVNNQCALDFNIKPLTSCGQFFSQVHQYICEHVTVLVTRAERPY